MKLAHGKHQVSKRCLCILLRQTKDLKMLRCTGICIFRKICASIKVKSLDFPVFYISVTETYKLDEHKFGTSVLRLLLLNLVNFIDYTEHEAIFQKGPKCRSLTRVIWLCKLQFTPFHMPCTASRVCLCFIQNFGRAHLSQFNSVIKIVLRRLSFVTEDV